MACCLEYDSTTGVGLIWIDGKLRLRMDFGALLLDKQDEDAAFNIMDQYANKLLTNK